MKRLERDIIRFCDGRRRRTIFEENGEYFAKFHGGMVKVYKDSYGVWYQTGGENEVYYPDRDNL